MARERAAAAIAYRAAMERITSPFGWATTATEVVADLDLSGKRFVVTGAASGIGVETVRALATAGAEVTLAVRNTAEGQRLADEIAGATAGNCLVHQLDLGDVASITAFADDWRGPLHGLVNNAGIMATPETRTPQGWEIQFATNHLGHFALASALRSALAEGAPSRIVSVSSVGHRRSPVMFDDIHFTSRPYDKWQAYGQSKTANVLFAVGVTANWGADGILANAIHPGGIMTNLQRHMDPAEFKVLGWVDEDGNPRAGFKTPEQGAATSTFAATSPLLDGVGGRYFEDCNEALPATPEMRTGGIESYAVDPGLADRLWTLSIAMLDELG
jgi:NAD(P)-dependent dehydrogenase (short-subunit alcohol dehydrogenase family)